MKLGNTLTYINVLTLYPNSFIPSMDIYIIYSDYINSINNCEHNNWEC